MYTRKHFTKITMFPGVEVLALGRGQNGHEVKMDTMFKCFFSTATE